MQVTIKSDNISAVIDSFGAELCSLRSGAGREYLWQAEPEVWKRHAPVLFPFICNTASKKYTVNGAEYSVANHGFARDSEFEMLYGGDSEAGFRLTSSEETKKLYPYDFELYIKYAAADSRIGVSYIVKNTDSRDIFFFIGGHPAFNVSDIDGCILRYEKPETVSRNGVLIADNTAEVSLNRELFAEDVFMKDKPASSWVTLVSKSDDSKVRLSYDKSGCIAVWSSYFEDKALNERAKFVCLEPWSSVPVYCENTEELTEMKNAVRLAPGRSHVFSYKIEIS